MEQQREIYRIILNGIGNNSLEDKETFCKKIAGLYGIPYEKLDKIVDKFPVVIKKNLTKKKAEVLAKSLKSFGAKVLIEKKLDSPKIYLEFQKFKPPRLQLDSAYLKKTPSGAWNILGRVKNIYKESLNDIWVLIQLFNEQDEFITFEEVPIPINPLPPGEISPFKVVFEGTLRIERISIAFKNSSGFPIPSFDNRKKKEWIEVFDENIEENQSSKIENSIIRDIYIQDSYITTTQDQNEFEGQNSLGSDELIQRGEREAEEVEKEVEREEKSVDLQVDLKLDLELEEGIYNQPKTNNRTQEEFSLEISEKMHEEGNIEKEVNHRFSWIENFRKSIEEFYKKNDDIFSSWFKEIREKKEFENEFHSILTILIHARFVQTEEQESALKNTERVFKLVLKPNILLDDIPQIEGTTFFSSEEWRELFYRALTRLKEVANEIIKKKRWEILALERLIQVIPHMGEQNSRLAIGWMKRLIKNNIEIDSTNGKVFIGERLYRVASRLGVVNPIFDTYQGENSMGDIKIQSFAKEVFPQDPTKIEDPMNWVGNEKVGFCYPIEPQCGGCLFEEYCPKLYISFNPSGKGMFKVF